MRTTDQKRTDLHNFVRENWGTEMGDTLMEFLPNPPWTDVATRQDIANIRVELGSLRQNVDADMRRIESRMDSGFANIDKSLKAINWRITGLISILVPVFLAYATALRQLK